MLQKRAAPVSGHVARLGESKSRASSASTWKEQLSRRSGGPTLHQIQLNSHPISVLILFPLLISSLLLSLVQVGILPHWIKLIALQ